MERTSFSDLIIFTTSSIKQAQKYYRIFRDIANGESEIKVPKVIKEKAVDFPRVAITYSISQNEKDSEDNKKDRYESFA